MGDSADMTFEDLLSSLDKSGLMRLKRAIEDKIADKCAQTKPETTKYADYENPELDHTEIAQGNVPISMIAFFCLLQSRTQSWKPKVTLMELYAIWRLTCRSTAM